jgi:NADPH2 dehydrogenase
MGMKDPIPQFTHLLSSIKQRHPAFAYLHIVEPRMAGNEDVPTKEWQGQSNDFIRELWESMPLISAGGYTRDSAMNVAEKHANELVAFGRHFLANVSSERVIDSLVSSYDDSLIFLSA